MAKFKSAKEQFDYIKKEFFKGNELDGITGMSAEERVEFNKKNIERLLANDINALAISDCFWTADRSRIIIWGKNNWFFNADDLANFSEQEREQLEYLKDFAGLCHDLALHFPFDNSLIGWPRYMPFAFKTPRTWRGHQGMGRGLSPHGSPYGKYNAQRVNIRVLEAMLSAGSGLSCRTV